MNEEENKTVKKNEMEAKLPALIREMGIEGLRDELAEYFETAGAGGREQLQKLSGNAVRDLYVATFADRDGEPAGWYEEWHKDYMGS